MTLIKKKKKLLGLQLTLLIVDEFAVFFLIHCWDNEMLRNVLLAYYKGINLGLFLIKTKRSKPQLSFPSFTLAFLLGACVH